MNFGRCNIALFFVRFLNEVVKFLQWAFMQDRAEQGGAAYVQQQVKIDWRNLVTLVVLLLANNTQPYDSTVEACSLAFGNKLCAQHLWLCKRKTMAWDCCPWGRQAGCSQASRTFTLMQNSLIQFFSFVAIIWIIVAVHVIFSLQSRMNRPQNGQRKCSAIMLCTT
jgi:hypothetical protein